MTSFDEKYVIEVMLCKFWTLPPCEQARASLVEDEKPFEEGPRCPSQQPATYQTCKRGHIGPAKPQQTS